MGSHQRERDRETERWEPIKVEGVGFVSCCFVLRPLEDDEEDHKLHKTLDDEQRRDLRATNMKNPASIVSERR